MAERNPEVLELVRKKLRESRDYSTAELKEAAEEIDQDIRALTARQFNARYPLQVRRELATEGAGDAEAENTARDGDSLRPTVRQVLVDFARDVAGAEDRARVIDVVTSVEEYVDRVLE